MPNPPASLTARTSRLPEIVSIGANRIGCRIPSRAVNSVLIAMRWLPVLDSHCKAAYYSLKMNTRERRHLSNETEFCGGIDRSPDLFDSGAARRHHPRRR